MFYSHSCLTLRDRFIYHHFDNWELLNEEQAAGARKKRLGKFSKFYCFYFILKAPLSFMGNNLKVKTHISICCSYSQPTNFTLYEDILVHTRTKSQSGSKGEKLMFCSHLPTFGNNRVQGDILDVRSQHCR